MSIQDLPSVSILPVGDVDESTQGFVDPEVIRELVIFEDIKFGGNDPSTNANRTAYFTPNEFLGSRVMSGEVGMQKWDRKEALSSASSTERSIQRNDSQRGGRQGRFDSIPQANLGGETLIHKL